jgi:hypothetical protein
MDDRWCSGPNNRRHEWAARHDWHVWALCLVNGMAGKRLPLLSSSIWKKNLKYKVRNLQQQKNPPMDDHWCYCNNSRRHEWALPSPSNGYDRHVWALRLVNGMAGKQLPMTSPSLPKDVKCKTRNLQY